mmetsp:Transcript_66200/g.160050  ORF Transcript_66200/g.160050 Transcript_66200/m.160050 type:complete len:473 (-) Transcript_66200:92-1510(-)
MPPRLRRASAEEVRRRWAALSFERKQDLMRFDDPCLVERIKSALQALFQKQMLMNTLGIKLTTAADPFAASALFTSAFEFTWQIARSTRNPSMILVDPMCMPVMAMKATFLEGDTIFRELGEVLPDLLSEKSGRAPLPKARWKDLWAIEPSSVQAMEQQLVKLVEQVLWAIGADPSCEVQRELEGGSSEPVPFEPWMESGESPKAKAKTGDAKKRKKQQKKQRASAASMLSEVTSSTCSVGASLPEEEEEDEEEASLAATPAPAVEEDEEPSEGHFSPDDAEHRSADEALSDDSSVGMGTMHFPGTMHSGEVSTSEVSREPTAASTPCLAHAKSRMASRRPMGSPVHSPLARHQAMSSGQLVCYIWNQASRVAPPASPRSTSGPAQAQACSTQATSPFSRGQWTGPVSPAPGTPAQLHSPVLSAVVRKTFVDIDDPNEFVPEPHRTSRSLPPTTRLAEATDASDLLAYHWHL